MALVPEPRGRISIARGSPVRASLKTPQLARRWILAGYQCLLSVIQAVQHDSDGHGEDERLDMGRTSHDLFPPSVQGFSAPSRCRNKLRLGWPCWLGDQRVGGAGVPLSYHTGPGAAQGCQARKSRRQSTSMMKPFIDDISSCWAVPNVLDAAHLPRLRKK